MLHDNAELNFNWATRAGQTTDYLSAYMFKVEFRQKFSQDYKVDGLPPRRRAGYFLVDTLVKSSNTVAEYLTTIH